MLKKNLVIIFVFLACFANAQNPDTGHFRTYPAGFYHKEIHRSIIGDEAFSLSKYRAVPYFKMEFGERIYPVHIVRYQTVYHSVPVSQGKSGTCWSYSATSFMESEVHRLQAKKIKLSEIFTVYWDYVERAEHFVETKGKTYLGEGSEANAIKRIMRNYGMMPYEAYNGLLQAQIYNNHSELFDHYETYLNYIKANELWDKEKVVDSIKLILDKYIGTPPQKFVYESKTYTAKTFMTDYLKLNPNNYFSFMSTKEYSYNEKHELVEPDNWWHCNDYYNISLEDYMILFHKAISSGYTISLCGDVSEPGYCQIAEVAVVPTFDIPSEYINEDSRQLRLTNASTTDDHCIHVVGYQKYGDVYWYLIKDSGSGAFDGRNKGYRFYHEDYIKLKMMNYMIHVDAAREFLDKIIK